MDCGFSRGGGRGAAGGVVEPDRIGLDLRMKLANSTMGVLLVFLPLFAQNCISQSFKIRTVRKQ